MSNPPAYHQDMPPAGGFSPGRFVRTMPKWGPSGKGWWAIGIGTFFLGLIGQVYRNHQWRYYGMAP